MCKPLIRKAAAVGDWIIGVKSTTVGYPLWTLIQSNDRSSTSHGDDVRLYFAMKVTQIITMEEYDDLTRDPAWKVKVPQQGANVMYCRTVGDCVYDFKTKSPRQRKCPHIPTEARNDLSGRNVLLSDHFYYFGGNNVRLPAGLQAELFTSLRIKTVKKLGRGFRRIDNSKLEKGLGSWLSKEHGGFGVLGPPAHMLDISKVRKHKLDRARAQ